MGCNGTSLTLSMCLLRLCEYNQEQEAAEVNTVGDCWYHPASVPSFPFKLRVHGRKLELGVRIRTEPRCQGEEDKTAPREKDADSPIPVTLNDECPRQTPRGENFRSGV